MDAITMWYLNIQSDVMSIILDLYKDVDLYNSDSNVGDVTLLHTVVTPSFLTHAKCFHMN